MRDEQEQFGIPLHEENTKSLKTTQNCLRELFFYFFTSDFPHIDQKSNRYSEITFLISHGKAHHQPKQF